MLDNAQSHFYVLGIMEGESETNGNEASTSSPPAKPATSPTTNPETTTSEAEPVKMETDVEESPVIKEEEKDKDAPAVVVEVKPEPVEKPEEKEPVDEEMNSKQKHQLNQRELFLSKQVEILPATNIRGKCSVTLLNETESFSSYIDKEVLQIAVTIIRIVRKLSIIKFVGRVFLYVGVRSGATNSAS